jgi:hypothetical protein
VLVEREVSDEPLQSVVFVLELPEVFGGPTGLAVSMNSGVATCRRTGLDKLWQKSLDSLYLGLRGCSPSRHMSGAEHEGCGDRNREVLATSHAQTFGSGSVRLKAY